MNWMLIGLLFCGAATWGEEVTDSPSAKDPSVLRIVSALISPYLELRPPEPEAESEPEAETGLLNATLTPESEIATSSAPRANDTDLDPDNTTSVPKSATTSIDVAIVTSLPTTAVPEPMTPYQGFIPDMMDLLLPHLAPYNITSYEIYTVEGDEAYTKMMNDVMIGKADVAASPMTVTLNKDDYVDFTYPFQKVEATIVMDTTLSEQIKSLDDLVNQDPSGEHRLVNYGVREDGAIHKVLQASEDELHKKIMNHINTNDVALKRTNADGVNRARYSGYAFIIESSAADWVVGQPPCTLVALKAGFFRRQYALAVAQGSVLRDRLNRAIIMSESGIEELRDKWLRPGECNSAPLRVQPTLMSSLFISIATIVLALYL